jgi:hypothetical protein
MSKGADGRRPSCLTCEPSTDTPAIRIAADADQHGHRLIKPVR